MSNGLSMTSTFTGLVDLAAGELGGRALGCSDDFFAGMENLVKPGRGVFLPDKYTERGKWMDGWESRRKRGPGHDWCILKLGAPGIIRGLDIDTHHFLGNHPPYASVEGIFMAPDTSLEALQAAVWTPVLAESPLRPGSQNLFAAQSDQVFTHVRLNIFPDGGVARLRVYGEVHADWTSVQPEDEIAASHLKDGEVDLAAVRNGGVALCCSDSFFGPMNNLLLPGRSKNMGGGWETRRRRGPGYDWIVVRLAEIGTPRCVEIDTHLFKGNFPDRCQIEGLYMPEARLTELALGDLPWVPLLPMTKLMAHTRHFYRTELAFVGPLTHVRVSIYPDGGISRLRVFGLREAK